MQSQSIFSLSSVMVWVLNVSQRLCGMLGDQLMVLFGKEHGTFKKWSPEQLGWLDGGVEGRRGEGEEGLGKGDCHQA